MEQQIAQFITTTTAFNKSMFEIVEKNRKGKIATLRRIIEKQDERIYAMEQRIRYLLAIDVGKLDHEEYFEAYEGEEFDE